MKFRKLILSVLLFAVLLTSLVPQNIYLLILLSMSGFLLLPLKKYWDQIAIAIILFSLFYTIMVVLGGEFKSGFMTLSYLITPVSLYRYGRFIMDEDVEEKPRIRLIMFMAFAYLLNVFVLTIVDMSIVGIVNEDRALLGHSADDDALAATLYGLMSSVGVGMLGVLLARKVGVFQRIFSLVVVVMSLLVVVHLINRTGLVVAVVCLFFTILYRENFKVFKILLLAGVLALVGFAVFASGLIDPELLEAYQKREAARGMGLSTAGGRTDLWFEALGELFVSPLGWKQHSYAHNMWLDLAKIGGWFAFVPFTVATFMYFKCLWKLVRMPYSNIALLLISMNVAMLLASFVEPVIEGSMLFFALLMFLWGMTVSVVNKSRLKF